MVDKVKTLRTVPTVSVRTDGTTVFDLSADEANSSWLLAGRLAKKARDGDRKAAEQLERMSATPMMVLE